MRSVPDVDIREDSESVFAVNALGGVRPSCEFFNGAQQHSLTPGLDRNSDDAYFLEVARVWDITTAGSAQEAAAELCSVWHHSVNSCELRVRAAITSLRSVSSMWIARELLQQKERERCQ